MGLFLRLNLFLDVTPEQVFDCFSDFYVRRGQALVDSGDEVFRFNLYPKYGRWAILELDGGWERDVRREAYLTVSRELACKGFFIFVYDGDFWGYELFRNGEPLDHFVQDADADARGSWFPPPSKGDANAVTAQFPWITPSDVAPYLVQKPSSEEFGGWEWVEQKRKLDTRVRPSEKYTRLDALAFFDFMRLLGIDERFESDVFDQNQVWRSFWIEGQNTFREHKKMYPTRGGG